MLLVKQPHASIPPVHASTSLPMSDQGNWMDIPYSFYFISIFQVNGNLENISHCCENAMKLHFDESRTFL
jgi:hypothetical protein